MTEHAAGGDMVIVQGRAYDLSVADGHLRVHLPFRVDPRRFTRYLMDQGYPLSHEADEVTDAQGWGPDFDPQAYYPWWIYPDPERPGGYCFALNPRPEDVIEQAGRAVPSISEESRRDVQRWVPILERFVQ